MPNVYRLSNWLFEVTCSKEIEPCRRDWLFDIETAIERCFPIEGRQMVQCTQIASLRLRRLESNDTYPVCASCWETITKSLGGWQLGGDPRIRRKKTENRLFLPDNADAEELYRDPVRRYNEDPEGARRHFTALVERYMRMEKCSKKTAMLNEFSKIAGQSEPDLRGYYDAVRYYDPPIVAAVVVKDAVFTTTQTRGAEPAALTREDFEKARQALFDAQMRNPPSFADQYKLESLPEQAKFIPIPSDHIRMHYTIGSTPPNLKTFIGELATDVKTEHECNGPGCPWCEILNARHSKDE
jgi:hypothetical protein